MQSAPHKLSLTNAPYLPNMKPIRRDSADVSTASSGSQVVQPGHYSHTLENTVTSVATLLLLFFCLLPRCHLHRRHIINSRSFKARTLSRDSR